MAFLPRHMGRTTACGATHALLLAGPDKLVVSL